VSINEIGSFVTAPKAQRSLAERFSAGKLAGLGDLRSDKSFAA
jgi:hypothetical protein